jgi:hypothetical protein
MPLEFDEPDPDPIPGQWWALGELGVGRGVVGVVVLGVVVLGDVVVPPPAAHAAPAPTLAAIANAATTWRIRTIEHLLCCERQPITRI